MSRLMNSLTTHWNTEEMLSAVYKALCKNWKELTLTQQCRPIALPSEHMMLSFAVWHFRNGLICSASKRKITYGDCNCSMNVSVATAALSVLPKQRPFLMIHKLEMIEPGEKYTAGGLQVVPGPWSTSKTIAGGGVTAFGWRCNGDITNMKCAPIRDPFLKTSAGLLLLSQKRHCEERYETEMLFDSSLFLHFHKWR